MHAVEERAGWSTTWMAQHSGPLNKNGEHITWMRECGLMNRGTSHGEQRCDQSSTHTDAPPCAARTCRGPADVRTSAGLRHPRRPKPGDPSVGSVWAFRLGYTNCSCKELNDAHRNRGPSSLSKNLKHSHAYFPNFPTVCVKEPWEGRSCSSQHITAAVMKREVRRLSSERQALSPRGVWRNGGLRAASTKSLSHLAPSVRWKHLEV